VDCPDCLTTNGRSGAEADEQIKIFNEERNQEIRKVGSKSTVIGAVLTSVSGLLIYRWLARS